MSNTQVTSIRELLSDISHDIWSHWTKYQFSKCYHLAESKHGEGLLIGPSLMNYWTRQMNTPYSELSEPEKDEDRREADKIIAHLKANGYVIVKAEDYYVPKQAQP